jgi:predicted Zn-dependent peptidase
MSQMFEEFKQGDLDLKTLEETKLKILLAAAKGYGTNKNFAEYYAASSFYFNKYGTLQNYEDKIEKITLEDIRRVSNKYFHPANRVVAVSSPTLTYTQFYTFILLMMAVVSVMVWRIVLRVRRRRLSVY